MVIKASVSRNVVLSENVFGLIYHLHLGMMKWGNYVSHYLRVIQGMFVVIYEGECLSSYFGILWTHMRISNLIGTAKGVKVYGRLRDQ